MGTSPQAPLPYNAHINSSYSYTLLSVVSTFFTGAFLGMRVGAFRKAAKVPYPYEYASYEQVTTAAPAQAKLLDNFNRAQRGHQNFNENIALVVGAILITGITYPTAAPVLGFTWSVNRIIYALGYTNGAEGGKGRYYGAAGMIAQYVLFIMSAMSAWKIANVNA